MDFYELEAFVALSESLHFSRAAAAVHLSASALSRLVGRLEEELGVTLFERDTRRASLTEEGETFLAFARETLHCRDDLRLRLGKHDERLRGILRVYASVTACYSILPPFVETLKAAHPDLRLSVETGDPADAAEAVREGRAELALDALPPGGFKDLECYPVRTTPLVLVSSATGPFGMLDLPDNDTVRLEKAMSSVPLILPKTGMARDRFDKWARNRGIKPTVAAETAGNEAILAFGRLGLGLGLVPQIVLENSPFAAGMSIYRTGSDFGEYEIGFVQKPTGAGTDSAQKLRRAIADIIKRTYPQ